MYYRTAIFFATLAIALIAGSGQASAQLPFDRTGTVTGSIHTDNDSPIANARIELHSFLGGNTVAVQYTNADGSFDFTGVPCGAYEVRILTGLYQGDDRVQVEAGQNALNLRVPASESSKTGEHSASGQNSMVSVKQLQVPAKSASLVNKARAAMNKGKSDEARSLLSKALDVFPNNAEALTLRGVLELDDKQPAQAEADVEKAIQADPNYGLAYIVLGSVRNVQSNYADAIHVLERGITLAPKMWQAYFEYSKALLSLGKFQDALRESNKALGLLTHEFPALHLIRGYAYLGLKLYHPAVPELEAYLQSGPQGPNAEQARVTLEKVRTLASAIP
jgi:tetratricopeptide (TPR) repeat protein